MGKINRCLKCLLIFFNVLFAILGCVWIYGAIKHSAIIDQLSVAGCPSLVWICLFAISVLGISCLGIYAAFSEKEILLKIFAGYTGLVLIIMLIFGIFVADTRNKVKWSFDSAAAEVAEPFMENAQLRTLLHQFQQSHQCCGVVSASDWRDNIPNSCECSGYRYGEYGGYGGSECTSKPQGVSGPDRIYAQPCNKVKFMSIDSVLKAAIGLCFGFGIIALLGLLLSHEMIRQVENHDSSGILSRPLTPDP